MHQVLLARFPRALFVEVCCRNPEAPTPRDLAAGRRTLACARQQFNVMTSHKPFGRHWVTKEQYIRYFMMCARHLDPSSGASDRELRSQLSVRQRRHSLKSVSVPCDGVYILRLLVFGRRAVTERVCAGVALPSSQRVQDEWERDSCGMPAMTGAVFFNAVFELIGACVSAHGYTPITAFSGQLRACAVACVPMVASALQSDED